MALDQGVGGAERMHFSYLGNGPLGTGRGRRGEGVGTWTVQHSGVFLLHFERRPPPPTPRDLVSFIFSGFRIGAV